MEREVGSIEREVRVAAPPDVVYEVLSTPEHLALWWSDDAVLDEARPGAEGELVFGTRSEPDAVVERLTVVEADPPRVFAFRWTHATGEAAAPGNSYLVTFELVPDGAGTLLRMVETGFRERGWEVAVLEERYADHVQGWDWFLPRLAAHATALAQARP
jgi:uncharacterized protein YndB with AHSA1/START domain